VLVPAGAVLAQENPPVLVDDPSYGHVRTPCYLADATRGSPYKRVALVINDDNGADIREEDRIDRMT
jgi:hypothetical protein